MHVKFVELVNISHNMAVRLRASARGWATHASNKLETLLQGDTIDIAAIKDAIEELDTRISALDAAQTAVEAELPDEQLDQSINEAVDFHDKVRESRIKATKIVAANGSPPASADMNTSHSSQFNARPSTEAKLPKIELPVFSGNVVEWTVLGPARSSSGWQ